MTIAKQFIRKGLWVTLVLGGIATADDARELTWEDLVPDTETIEQSADSELPDKEDLFDEQDWQDDSMEDSFSPPVYPTDVVRELDGALVKIPGYVVPLEVSKEGKVSEFLLVPYFGACVHFPPPPANQIVYIKAEEPIDLESTWDPIWVTGELSTEFRETGLAYAGYTMVAQATEVYEY